MIKKPITFLIFITFLLIYYAGSFSKISFGDCIGFVLDAEKREFLPDFMPLTHFLYINTAVFFTKFLGADSVSVMRLMSVVPAAITVSLVFVLIKEFVVEDWIALMSTVVLGFSFTFWRSAETVEVYSFNALWIILFLLYSVKSLKNGSSNYLIAAGIVLGLSLWVHIQNIMLIPAYVVLLYFFKTKRLISSISLISFLLIFALMLILNYANGIEPKYTFISRKPWVQNTFDQSFFDLIKDMAKALAFLLYNFHVFILFFVSGIFYLYSTFKRESLFLFVAAFFTVGFATFYAVSDNYVYFIPFYLICAVFTASGIKKLNAKFELNKIRFIPVMIPLFYVASLYIVSLTSQGREFHQKKLYKGGLHYYMLPWLNDNIGCLEFTLDDGQTEDNVEALKKASTEFIELRKKYEPMEKIREL